MFIPIEGKSTLHDKSFKVFFVLLQPNIDFAHDEA